MSLTRMYGLFLRHFCDSLVRIIWNKNTFYTSIMNNKINCFKYAINNGCYFDDTIFYSIIEFNRNDFLEYAIEKMNFYHRSAIKILEKFPKSK